MGFGFDDSDATCLMVVFTGHLDSVAGVESAALFAQALADRRRKVVWDVREMTGYDDGARAAWLRATWPRRQHIEGVHVIGGNSIIRFGARALCLALGIPCSFGDAVAPLHPRP